MKQRGSNDVRKDMGSNSIYLADDSDYRMVLCALYRREHWMTQIDRIQKYIEDFGSITTLDATKDLGIMRLSARISEMRSAGINVISTFETGKNRHDEPTRYVRYTIRREEA